MNNSKSINFRTGDTIKVVKLNSRGLTSSTRVTYNNFVGKIFKIHKINRHSAHIGIKMDNENYSFFEDEVKIIKRAKRPKWMAIWKEK